MIIILQRTDRNTRNSMLYTLQIVCGFFFVPQSTLSTLRDCQTGSILWHPYLRRLDSSNICRCHYKGVTFSSVIWKPQVLVHLGFWTCNLRHRSVVTVIINYIFCNILIFTYFTSSKHFFTTRWMLYFFSSIFVVVVDVMYFS